MTNKFLEATVSTWNEAVWINFVEQVLQQRNMFAPGAGQCMWLAPGCFRCSVIYFFCCNDLFLLLELVIAEGSQAPGSPSMFPHLQAIFDFCIGPESVSHLPVPTPAVTSGPLSEDVSCSNALPQKLQPSQTIHSHSHDFT